MTIALIVAAILRLIGPTADEVNADVAATLEDREACVRPLIGQPYDCPERVRWALTAISDRECPGHYSAKIRWVGRHSTDKHFESKLLKKGHRRGNLSGWCPFHWWSEGMSTDGIHGLMYIYTVHYLEIPGNCVPWWVFAAPQVSARTALAMYLDKCDTGHSWCPSDRAITRAEFNRRARRAL
jgi:hypothetical protein